MSDIRFKTLPSLLRDMRQTGWTITAFDFRYKKQSYVVILKMYGEEDRKPNEYAQASVEFCRAEDLTVSIFGYIDFYEVRFRSSDEFCRFFNVQSTGERRDLFLDFSEIFAGCIPPRRPVNPPRPVRDKMISRCEGDDPNAIYCWNVIRNGLSQNGVQKHRRAQNSNKAALAVPWLYEKLRDDDTISFCFTADIQKRREEAEIFADFARR